MSVDTSVRKASLIGELRTLKHTGLDTTTAARACEILGGLTEVLDVEAAGRLLAAPSQLEQLAATGLFGSQRFALLGSSTLDPLPNLLTAVMLRDGVIPDIHCAGFNQWRIEILSGAPNLIGGPPGITACLLDDTAIFATVANPIDVDEIIQRCQRFPEELGRWGQAGQQLLSGLIVLSTIPLSPLRCDRLIDYAAKARLCAAWARMNAAILDLAATNPRTVVLSHERVAARAGHTSATDLMRHVARQAYSPEFLWAYAEELGRVARAARGQAKKCLVLDLDNTVWGGVVGDDGVGALRLGESYPGSAYVELQALARDLTAQGVLLAISSKNDESVALEAIATHPEMVLRPESFLAVRINWEPKPANVAAIAEQLNIGLDAIVFVDDNPVERGLMRQLQPTVSTVELPTDPARYAASLAARGDFNLLTLTAEDRGRAAMYSARSKRTAHRESAGSLLDYLLDLDSRLVVEPVGELTMSRVAQLFGKTNQFNLTGRRYAEDEIRQRIASGTGAFHGARLTDRYGDNGLIAAFGLSRDGAHWTIDNVVLSCRVFSRGVEDAIVGQILRAALAQGAEAVYASFVPTARNNTFAAFYPDQGFVDITEPTAAPTGPRLYRHDLKNLPDLPSWIHITALEEVFHAL